MNGPYVLAVASLCACTALLIAFLTQSAGTNKRLAVLAFQSVTLQAMLRNDPNKHPVQFSNGQKGPTSGNESCVSRLADLLKVQSFSRISVESVSGSLLYVPVRIYFSGLNETGTKKHYIATFMAEQCVSISDTRVNSTASATEDQHSESIRQD